MQMATAIESDNGDMIVKRVSVPLGLEELMEGLTKEVLVKKPKDIYIFASEYFANLLQMREKTAFKGIPIRKSNSVIKQTRPEKITEKNRAKTLDSSNKKYFGRQKTIREQSPDVISALKTAPLNLSKIDKSKSIINKHNKARKELVKNNEKDVSSSNVSSTKSTPRATRDRSIKRDRSKDGKTVTTPRQKSQENKEQKIKINGRKIVSKTADKVVLSNVVKRPEVAKIAPSAVIKNKNKDAEVQDIENNSNQNRDISKESNDKVVGCKMSTNEAVDLTQKEKNNINKNKTKKIVENIAKSTNEENVNKNNENVKGDFRNIAELSENAKSAENSNKTEEKESTSDKKLGNKNENIGYKEETKSFEAENKIKTNFEKTTSSETEEESKLKAQEEPISEDNSTNSALENTINSETTSEETEDSLKNKEEVAQKNLKNTDEQSIQNQDQINADKSKKIEEEKESALDKESEEEEKTEKNTNDLNASSFDTSKLRDELNQASTTAQSSFKTSFNPFILRQEINKASESTKSNKNEDSKIEEAARQIAAAIKIQSLWRGFCDRKSARNNKILSKNKIVDERKQEEIKQVSEINSNEHSKIEETAMQVAAAVKIQSLWRKFSKRKNSKNNLNLHKTLSENMVDGKQNPDEVKKISEINRNEHLKMEETAKQIAAALKIQSVWRKFLSRKNELNSIKIQSEQSKENRQETENVENLSEMLTMAKAVLTIQRVWRGFQVRKLKKRRELFGTTIENELKEKEDLKTHFAENKNNAARKIQSLWRGYQVRKNVDEVNKHLSDLQKPTECDELPNQRGVISDADIFKAASKIQAGYRGYVARKKRNVNLTSISEEPLKDDEILRAIEQLDEIPTEPPAKVDKTEKTVSFITSPNKKLVKTFSMGSINNKSGQFEKLKSNSLETDQNADSYDGYIINDFSKQHSNVLAAEMKRNIENICKNYDNNKSILQDENNANIETETENTTTVAAEPAEYKTTEESISNSLNKRNNAVDSLQQSDETAYEEAPTRPVTSDIIQDPLHNPNLFSDVKPEDSTGNRNNIQMENVGIGLLKDTNLNNDKLLDEDKQVLHRIHKELNYEHDDDDAITVENIENQKRPLSLESNTSHDSVATVIFNDDNPEDKETLKNNEISEKDDGEIQTNTISGELSDFNKNKKETVSAKNESKKKIEENLVESEETEEKIKKESEYSENNNSKYNDERKTSITEIEKISLDEINKTESDNADNFTNPALQNASHLLEDNVKSSELLKEQSNDEKVDFKNKDEKIESVDASEPDSKKIESNSNKIEPLLNKENVGLENEHVEDENEEKNNQNKKNNKEDSEKNIEITSEKVEEKQPSKDKEIDALNHLNNKNNESVKQENKNIGDNKQESLNKLEEKQEVNTSKNELENKVNNVIKPLILKEKNNLEIANAEEDSNQKEDTDKNKQKNKEPKISIFEDKQDKLKSDEKQPFNNKEVETVNQSETEKNENAKHGNEKIGGSSEEKKLQSLDKKEETQEGNTLKNEIVNEVDNVVEPQTLQARSDLEVEEIFNEKDEKIEQPCTSKEKEIELTEKQPPLNNKDVKTLNQPEIQRNENAKQNDEKVNGSSEEKNLQSLNKQEDKQESNALKNENVNELDNIIEPLISKEKNDLEVQHANVEEKSNQNDQTDKKDKVNEQRDINKQGEIKSEEYEPLTINKEIEMVNHLDIKKSENESAKQVDEGCEVKEHESLSKQEEKQDILNDEIKKKFNNVVDPLMVKEKSNEIQQGNVEKNSSLKEECNEKTDNGIQKKNRQEINKLEKKTDFEMEENDTIENNEKISPIDNKIINEIKTNVAVKGEKENANVKQTKIGDNENKSEESLSTEETLENRNANSEKNESIDGIDKNSGTNNKSVEVKKNNNDIITDKAPKIDVQEHKKENNENNNKSSENTENVSSDNSKTTNNLKNTEINSEEPIKPSEKLEKIPENIKNTNNVSSQNTESSNDLKSTEVTFDKPIKNFEILAKIPENIIDKNETKNNNNTNNIQQEINEEAKEVKINNNTLHGANKMEEKPINTQNNEEENNLVELDAKTVDNNNAMPSEDEHNSEIENTGNNETLNVTKIIHKNNDDQDLHESSSIINKTPDPGTSNNDSNNKTQGNNNKNNSSSTSINEDDKIESTTDEAQVTAHSQIIHDSNKSNTENELKDHGTNKFDLSALQREIEDCGKEEHAKLNTKLLNQEIDDSDKKFKESVIASVKPDYYKQNNKNDDVEFKINEATKSMASGNAENNKLDVDKLQSEIFENINKSEFGKSSSEELVNDNNGDEFYIPIRELSDIKEEEGETKQFNDDGDNSEAEETPKSSSLVHSGELSDSLSLPAMATPPGRNSSRDGECQTEPLAAPGLVNTGEFHDNVLPVSVQLNEGSPAGPAVLTSEMSKSINNGISGQDKAQASSKDASTCETQPDNVSPLPISSMETEKRNNASLPAKKNMEAEAATKIQAGFRGYQVRKQLKSKKTAPGDISNQRRSARRKSSGRLTDSARNSQQKFSKQPQPSDLEEKSAVKIQAGVRGFLVRRRQKKQKGDDEDDESS